MAMILLIVALFIPISIQKTQIIGPQVVSAACNGLTVFENASGGSGQNDSWNNCGDRSNLHNNSNNLILGCNDTAPPPNNDWGDCISRITWAFTGTTQACLWTNTLYQGDGLKIAPGSSGGLNLGSNFNDKFSSIEVSNVDCSPGGAQRVANKRIIAEVGNNGVFTFGAP